MEGGEGGGVQLFNINININLYTQQLNAQNHTQFIECTLADI